MHASFLDPIHSHFKIHCSEAMERISLFESHQILSYNFMWIKFKSQDDFFVSGDWTMLHSLRNILEMWTHPQMQHVTRKEVLSIYMYLSFNINDRLFFWTISTWTWCYSCARHPRCCLVKLSLAWKLPAPNPGIMEGRVKKSGLIHKIKVLKSY